MTTTTETKTQRGGEWLLQSTDAASVFTPERMSDEHNLIARTAAEFVRQEVMPALDRLEQKDWGLARDLVKRAAALGLLGVDVPEAYGGVALDKVSSLVFSEKLAGSASDRTGGWRAISSSPRPRSACSASTSPKRTAASPSTKSPRSSSRRSWPGRRPSGPHSAPRPISSSCRWCCSAPRSRKKSTCRGC